MKASYEANKTLSLTWVAKPNPRSSFLTKTCIKHSITLYIIQTSCLKIEPGTISKSYSWLKRRLRRTSPSRFSISAVMAANNELFPEPTFPITPISCPCKKRKKLFNFLRSKGRALRLLLYIAIFCVTVIVSLRNRTAERRLFTFLRAGPPFVAVYSDILRYGNSEFTQQDGKKEAFYVLKGGPSVCCCI